MWTVLATSQGIVIVPKKNMLIVIWIIKTVTDINPPIDAQGC